MTEFTSFMHLSIPHPPVYDTLKPAFRDMNEIARLEKQKETNRLRLQVMKKLGNIPSKDELDRLLRYEGSIERQLYKALNQLERMQRLRAGDDVPPPVELDVDVNTGQNA